MSWFLESDRTFSSSVIGVVALQVLVGRDGTVTIERAVVLPSSLAGLDDSTVPYSPIPGGGVDRW